MPRAKPSAHDDPVTQVFLSSIEAGGGARQLIDRHQTDWLPDLMRAAYAVVAQEEEGANPEEITQRMQVSRESVDTLLSAPADVAVERLAGATEADTGTREEIAGGLARLGHARASAR